MTDYKVDVLVVGAGPVGLMAAWQLARWGVSVRLVDAAPGPATTSRALATHARTVYELYVVLGVGVCLGIAVGLVGTGWLYMEHVLYRARVRRASG